MDLDKIEKLGAQVAQQVAALRARRESLQKEMQALSTAGLIEASPYWHKNRYLYLVYPMVNGERRREYVGADTEKTSSALAAIRRAARSKELSARLTALDKQIREATSFLEYFLRVTAQ